MMLGVQGPDDFEANQSECTLDPGSMILAYTDGMIEARNPRGVALGLDRLRGIVGGAEPPNEWTNRLLEVVNMHARKALDDDVLVVTLAYHAAAEPRASNGVADG